MRELFALTPEDVRIDWSPDTFGHAATIPTYLARGGVTRYYCCRAGTHGPERPPVFWWQAPDGSRVLVNREIRWYLGTLGPDIGSGMIEFARETGLQGWMRVYGVGDHGGGPTRRDIAYGLEMDAWPVFPNVRFSTTEPFYAVLEEAGDRLPVLETELNFEFTGCYTSQSLIKKSNRDAENQLYAAETASALAWAALDTPYPADDLREGWQDTLFGHFHDILPGSGVHDTRTYLHGQFQKTAAMTSMVETAALRALAAQVDTTGDEVDAAELPSSGFPTGMGAGVGFGTATGALSAAERSVGYGPRPFVVFNPCGRDVTDVVRVTIWDASRAAGPFSVRMPDGELVPAQVMDTGKYWGHDYVTLAFPVSEVPGLGYGCYTVLESPSEPGEAAVTATGALAMENKAISVEIDPVSGGIRSLKLKEGGIELVNPARPAGVLEFAVERPHGMSAWSIDETGPVGAAVIRSVKRSATGPHVAIVEVVTRVNESELTVTYELRAGSPCLHVQVAGTWLERGSAATGVPNLRMAFPFALHEATARYETPFGGIDRDLAGGEEVPALRWAQVSGRTPAGGAGCTLLNDSKHGHSLDGSVLRLNLIRSSYMPDPLPEIGQHMVKVALCPFAGERATSDSIALGLALNRPLRVMGTDVHTGRWPRRAQLVSVSPDNVVVSCVKRAENGEGLTVRLYETAGRNTTARITLGESVVGPIQAAQETDVLERPIAAPTAHLAADGAEVDVPAFGLATVVVTVSGN